jgi:hypothetical protein
MKNYSFTQLAIMAIVILGVAAVVLIASQAMGIAIPSWVVQILWVLGIVFVAVLAIKLIASMWDGSGPPGP